MPGEDVPIARVAGGFRHRLSDAEQLAALKALEGVTCGAAPLVTGTRFVVYVRQVPLTSSRPRNVEASRGPR
jgi:hypothetical protein